MTVHLRIHCAQCGNDWYIYEGSDFHSIASRTCPCCGEFIDLDTWENQVIPAMGAAGDANRELEKDCMGYSAPLFHFDVISNYINDTEQPDIGKLRTDIKNLSGEIQSLNAAFEKLFNR